MIKILAGLLIGWTCWALKSSEYLAATSMIFFAILFLNVETEKSAKK